MRISRRTSGGRGEYEISEQAANGLTPADLFDRRIFLVFQRGWVIDTGVFLRRQGGKRRLRMGGATIQLQRQLAACLMMPQSVRAEAPLGGGLPILLEKRYAIEHVELRQVELQGDSEARLGIEEVILRNVSHHAEQLRYANRLADLDYVWGKRDELPGYLAILISEHRRITRAGGPVPEQAERVVHQIQQAVTEHATDLGILYRTEAQDALPDLVTILGEPPPEPPIKVTEVDPEDTEIRRRVVKEWKRWAASRGAASARFRQMVRDAWNSTCAVCGLHLPATSCNSSPGVDAAHILSWSEYDLDRVSNGICLCKHHHWAFDEGLIVIRTDGNDYRVEVPADRVERIASENAAFSIESLRAFEGPIPANRLPRRTEDRPGRQYLELLLENSR